MKLSENEKKINWREGSCYIAIIYLRNGNVLKSKTFNKRIHWSKILNIELNIKYLNFELIVNNNIK